MSKNDDVIMIHYDPVRGLTCGECGFEVHLPIGKGIARTVPKILVDHATNEMHNHIDTEHRMKEGQPVGIAVAALAKTAPTPQPGIDATLAERGKRYGKFIDHATVTQQLKDVFFTHRARASLTPDMAEAVEMIMHKLGRIATGDPHYADSWHDIAGYAKLVDDRLNGKTQ